LSDLKAHIIDDDEAVRDALGFLLSTEDVPHKGYATADAFLEVAISARGCVVTDVRMPGMDGLQLVRRLKEMGVTLPVIVMTGHGDVPLAVEAMKEGVADFFEKPFDDELILEAVRRAMAESGQGEAREIEKAEIAARIASLSGREREVLDGLLAGKANKVIAHDLAISPRTVEIYRANLMTKMRANSLSELVRMALRADVA
jgi:two-component system, LuxR family, response regulator FixJ